MRRGSFMLRWLLVVDAVQAIGRIPVEIEALDADFLIVSSHKIGGPKGVGALISRGEVMMPLPLIHGGGQEKGHRLVPRTRTLFSALVWPQSGARMQKAESARLASLREGLEMECASPRRMSSSTVRMSRASATRPSSRFRLEVGNGQIAFDIEGVALSQVRPALRVKSERAMC